MIRFDHLAIGALDLGAGADAVEAALGVRPPMGGRHDQMGTHNLLTATGPDTFLEVIAIDPDAPAPGRRRWFGLDDPVVAARLATPRPHAIVAASDDLDAAIAAAKHVGVDYGEALTVTRGDLTWRFAVRDDGAIPLDGAAPLLMEWPAGPHPAGRMADLGLRFCRIEIRTPEAGRLKALLTALGGLPVSVSAAMSTAILAEITGPGGRRAVLGAEEVGA